MSEFHVMPWQVGDLTPAEVNRCIEHLEDLAREARRMEH